MELFLSWCASNWASILVGVLFVVACYILIKKGYKQNVAIMCLFLVNKAEEKFGAGTGEIKYEWVLSHLYPVLPPVLKFFITENEIDDAIENAVDMMQEFLENQSK